jgi:NAD+ diphosphatase
MDFDRSKPGTLFPAALIDRRANTRRSSAELAKLAERAGSRFVPVWRGLNLFDGEDAFHPAYLSLREAEALLDGGATPAFLGERDSIAYFSVELPKDEEACAPLTANGACFKDLRGALPTLGGLDAELLAHAKGLFHWHASHRYCGFCGTPTVAKECGHLLLCTNDDCRKQHFPRTDPAIITVVAKDDKCLLGRQAYWPEGAYSTLAGFVEPGETLESAVAREVFEETGVKIAHATYRGSQPWPFPASVMVGFSAEAISEEIVLDEEELADARWFTREDIRQGFAAGNLGLPPKSSIAYRLIEQWYDAGGEGALGEVWWDNWTGR